MRINSDYINGRNIIKGLKMKEFLRFLTISRIKSKTICSKITIKIVIIFQRAYLDIKFY